MTMRARFQVIIVAGFVILSAAAAAQTIIPVDPRFPPPDGFTFQGRWKCGDSAAAEILRIGKPGNRTGWHSRLLASTWTAVRETDHYLAGRYFVAYDRDKRQFIMLDADDPAYAAYSTDGWRDQELTLTSEETQLMPKHRLVYKIENRNQFTVIYAVLNNASWVSQSSFTCRKVEHR